MSTSKQALLRIHSSGFKMYNVEPKYLYIYFPNVAQICRYLNPQMGATLTPN